MVPCQDIEDRLRCLGKSLPKSDKLVGSVLAEIERRAITPATHTPWKRIASLFVGAAALLLIAAVSWFALTTLGEPRTLYAAVIEALRNADTFHLTLTVQTERGPVTAYEAWYKRDAGYSMRRGPDVWINNGHRAYAYTAGQPTAVQWTENICMDANNPLIRQMQLPNCGFPTRRVPEADQVIRGGACLAYEYEPGPKDQPLTPVPNQVARLMIWINGSQRVERTERQIKQGATWKADLVWNIEYDVPIASSQFDPKVAFGPDVRIVDATKAFDERFGLANAIYKKNVGGLWYAVHEFKACADGMILVVSSIRRDEQTLREFPPEYRSIRPGLMIAEAARQQFSYDCQIELATAIQGPVLVQWWLLVPLPVYDYDSSGPITPQPGKVMFRAQLIYHDGSLEERWKKEQAGAKVERLPEVLAVLDAPSRENPLQRPQLAALIYKDLASLQRSAFTSMVWGREIATSGRLRGEEVQVSKDPSEVTAQQYAERLVAYLTMREHESNDQLLRELERLKTSEVPTPASEHKGKPAR